MAYYRLEPFGPEIDHVMIAELTALTANVNRNRRKRSRPYEAKEFMPGERPAAVENDPEEFRQRVDAAMSMFVALANAKAPKKEAS